VTTGLATPEAKDDPIDQFVDETEGLRVLDMQAIAHLECGEGAPCNRMLEAVRRFKDEVTEDRWAKLDRDKFRNAGSFIGDRVKGQDQAVEHVLGPSSAPSPGTARHVGTYARRRLSR